MYSVITDAKGEDVITRTSDGACILLDPDDPSFCEFLNWAVANNDHVPQNYRYQETFTFFCRQMKEQLLERLRSGGHMVFVNLPSQAPRLKHDGGPLLHGGRQFWPLYRAAELPTDTGQAAYGGICPADDPIAWVSKPLLDELSKELADEQSEIRRLSSWPVTRAFVYVDVSDFSQFQAGQQALVIKSLTLLSSDARYWRSLSEEAAFQNIEARLCIGDGYIFVFTNAALATFFAARLAVKVEHCGVKRLLPIRFHFRMGVHVGSVYHFWDAGRQDWNYVGDGINGGARVLQAIGKDYDDLIFLSDEMRQAIRRAESVPKYIREGLIKAMRPRGRHADKHGNRWRVYEVTHDLVRK